MHAHPFFNDRVGRVRATIGIAYQARPFLSLVLPPARSTSARKSLAR